MGGGVSVFSGLKWEVRDSGLNAVSDFGFRGLSCRGLLGFWGLPLLKHMRRP